MAKSLSFKVYRYTLKCGVPSKNLNKFSCSFPVPTKPSPDPSLVTQKPVIQQMQLHMIYRDAHKRGRSEKTIQTYT